MTKFLLIRHATNYTVGKRIAGRMAGVSLNEEGQEQANKLAHRLKDLPISAIYSSPLERAIETAEPLAATLGKEVKVNEDFLEINFGNWTNLTIEELEKDATFQLYNSFRSFTEIPGGELMVEAQVRVIKGLKKLCIQHPNETVAVFSHGDLVKAAVAYYAGIPLDMFLRLEISPASVSIINVFEETAQIQLVNDTGEIKF
jgi:probable phosphoglycerate mutase